MVTRDHSMPRSRINASIISNWLAPVATITLAADFSAKAWRSALAPALAALFPKASLSWRISTFIAISLQNESTASVRATYRSCQPRRQVPGAAAYCAATGLMRAIISSTALSTGPLSGAMRVMAARRGGGGCGGLLRRHGLDARDHLVDRLVHRYFVGDDAVHRLGPDVLVVQGGEFVVLGELEGRSAV